MGLFNAFLKGLGFEGDDEPKKEKKQKKLQSGEFDLSQQTAKTEHVEAEEQEYFEEEPQYFEEEQEEYYDEEVEAPEMVINRGAGDGVDTLRLVPQNQAQVQIAVEHLKAGKNIVLDLSAFGENDMVRALDFLSGVAYCLETKINKLDSVTYTLYR